jgi:hypothetical protein
VLEGALCQGRRSRERHHTAPAGAAAATRPRFTGIVLGALAMTQGFRSAVLDSIQVATIPSGWPGKRRKITPTNPKSGPMTMANESLLNRPPLRSSLRWGVAIAATIAAGAHIPIIPDHLHEAPNLGTPFVLPTVTCVGLAAVVLVYDVPLVYAAAVTV